MNDAEFKAMSAREDELLAAHGRMAALEERVRLWKNGDLDLSPTEIEEILAEAGALVLQCGGKPADTPLH